MSYQFLDAYSSVQSADSSVVSGVIQRPIVNIGSILSAIPTVSTGNSSVSGTLGASVIGLTPINLTHIQGGTTGVVGNGTVGVNTLRVAIATDSAGPGSVVTFQGGTQITSLVSTVPSSVLVGASIFGQLPGGTAVLGSVATLQGTPEWTVKSSLAGGVFPISGSVAATITNTNVNVSGSVAAFIQGNSSVIVLQQSPSIVGTYVEDAAHTTGDRGLFHLGVRNDTLSSVTSADGDYSPTVQGPAGETIVADAPFTKWVSGIADLRVVQGASVVAITAPGASIFTYIREVQVANFGPSSVLVKIGGGLGSTLGWTIAPAGGGSNYTARLKTGENSAVTASINGTASVLVTMSGFTAKI